MLTGAVEIGQGSDTVKGMIAAEELRDGVVTVDGAPGQRRTFAEMVLERGMQGVTAAGSFIAEIVAPDAETMQRISHPTYGLAAIVVAVVGGSVGLTGNGEVTRLRAETARLEAVAATFDRVLAAPQHWSLTLRTADGAPAGTMAWSAAEIVVVTTGLPAPGDGQAYRCWVEINGTRTPMGAMSYAGSTGYWVGSMYQWSETIGPGARYGVSLVSEGGPATPVLVGTL